MNEASVKRLLILGTNRSIQEHKVGDQDDEQSAIRLTTAEMIRRWHERQPSQKSFLLSVSEFPTKESPETKEVNFFVSENDPEDETAAQAEQLSASPVPRVPSKGLGQSAACEASGASGSATRDIDLDMVEVITEHPKSKKKKHRASGPKCQSVAREDTLNRSENGEPSKDPLPDMSTKDRGASISRFPNSDRFKSASKTEPSHKGSRRLLKRLIHSIHPSRHRRANARIIDFDDIEVWELYRYPDRHLGIRQEFKKLPSMRDQDVSTLLDLRDGSIPPWKQYVSLDRTIQDAVDWTIRQSRLADSRRKRYLGLTVRPFGEQGPYAVLFLGSEKQDEVVYVHKEDEKLAVPYYALKEVFVCFYPHRAKSRLILRSPYPWIRLIVFIMHRIRIAYHGDSRPSLLTKV